MKLKSIGYISIYYLIALTFKYYAVYVHPETFLISNQQNNYSSLFLGLGPLIGGLVLVYIFKRSNDLTLFITGVVKPLSILILLIGLFLGFSYYNTGHLDFSIVSYILVALIYSSFEEYGWRGYLQTELKPLNKLLKYVIISVLWFFWHLEFEYTFFGYLIVLIGSIGMGYVADKSKSLIYVAIFHTLVNLAFTSDLDNTPFLQRIIIVCLVAVVMIITMRWNRNKVI